MKIKIILAFLTIYHMVISKFILAPFFGPKVCRFQPSCSVYTKEAIEKFGIKKGGYLGLKRILSCRPYGGFGFDPVPEK